MLEKIQSQMQSNVSRTQALRTNLTGGSSGFFNNTLDDYISDFDENVKGSFEPSKAFVGSQNLNKRKKPPLPNQSSVHKNTKV